MTMKCPKCHNKMKASEFRGAPSATCSRCSGTWISGESLHDLLEIENDYPVLLERFEALFDLDFDEGSRACPACVERKLKLIDIDGTEIDFCPTCKGLFFDKGELREVFSNDHELPDEPTDDAQESAIGFFWEALIRFINGSGKGS